MLSYPPVAVLVAAHCAWIFRPGGKELGRVSIEAEVAPRRKFEPATDSRTDAYGGPFGCDLQSDAAFLDLVKQSYGAPLEEMDFATDPEKARAEINRWIAEQTKDRIRDLLPRGAITPDMSLALVNALYLRAPWNKAFKEKATKAEQFLVHGREAVDVPMMQSARINLFKPAPRNATIAIASNSPGNARKTLNT